MSQLPTWLPTTVSVDGNFDKVLVILYNIFHEDFVVRKPHLRGVQVWHDRRIKQGETYEEGFWHLITRDYSSDGTRTFDPRRAERLPWCAPLINNSHHDFIKFWLCKEHKKLVCYLWLEEFDYIVIFEKRTLKARPGTPGAVDSREIAFLKTAYHVDGESKRRYFRRKYNRRIE